MAGPLPPGNKPDGRKPQRHHRVWSLKQSRLPRSSGTPSSTPGVPASRRFFPRRMRKTMKTSKDLTWIAISIYNRFRKWRRRRYGNLTALSVEASFFSVFLTTQFLIQFDASELTEFKFFGACIWHGRAACCFIELHCTRHCMHTYHIIPLN